jgi:hypothetical protein
MRSTIQTCFRFLIPVTLVMLSPIPATEQHAASVRDTAANIVSRIQRADYEGDRSALQALHEELAVLRLPGDDHHLASRVRYWRGFALWRRALNGFSGAADPKELERDLQQALRDFEDSARHDPQFVDASVGAISCLQNLAHLSRSRKDAARASELVRRLVPMLKESRVAAPDNPRLLWVVGAGQWYNPPERGGGQAIAIATYKKGLELVRQQRRTLEDPLEPSWGEPELLMNLALASLNQTAPNVRAAEEYATRALTLVPYWHYVRNTLIPQIQSAKGKQ